MSVSSLPLVSVIIPCYNRAHTIHTTLGSVLDQVYGNVEVVIVDDGSTDDTANVIKKIADGHSNIFFYQRSGPVKGANVCRNTGLERSTGTYILFLDSDDLLRPFCISERVKMFSKIDTRDFLVFPGATFAQNINEKLFYWNIPREESDLERFFRFDGPWQTSGAFWKREVLTREKMSWDESLQIWQDIDFHTQAILRNLQYDICWEMEPDYLVRSGSEDSISRTNYNSPEKIRSRQYFWDKYAHIVSHDHSFSADWLQPIFMIVLKAAVLKKKIGQARDILKLGLKLKVINNIQYNLLKKNMLLSWFTFNKITFPSPASMAVMGNYKPSVQRIPVNTTGVN